MNDRPFLNDIERYWRFCLCFDVNEAVKFDDLGKMCY